MHETPEVRHRPRPGSIILGLLVVTIAATAGYLVGSLRETTESKALALPIVEQSQLEPAWASALRSELNALREEVRMSRAIPESRTPANTGSTSEVGPRVDLARLDAAIARLEARTKLSAQAARSPPEPRLLERLAHEASRFEWQAVGGFTNAAGYDEWLRESQEALTRSHRLWTMEDVLQAYGSPDKSTGSMVSYAVRSLDSETSVVLQFWFEGDRVTNAQVDTGSPR